MQQAQPVELRERQLTLNPTKVAAAVNSNEEVWEAQQDWEECMAEAMGVAVRSNLTPAYGQINKANHSNSRRHHTISQHTPLQLLQSPRQHHHNYLED
mmetsp:Transcript_14224/g.24145  ORF Transcript_14224/g.24145 Transcript_14224/m.24145 type:complete len:98 (+) Transcript_14224:92-385(+)